MRVIPIACQINTVEPLDVDMYFLSHPRAHKIEYRIYIKRARSQIDRADADKTAKQPKNKVQKTNKEEPFVNLQTELQEDYQ